MFEPNNLCKADGSPRLSASRVLRTLVFLATQCSLHAQLYEGMVKNKSYSGLLLTIMSDFLRPFTTKNAIKALLRVDFSIEDL